MRAAVRGLLLLCAWHYAFLDGPAPAPSRSCRAAAAVDRREMRKLDRDVPAYMLKACGGDERLALQRWTETLKWRCEIGDEEMFSKPYPNFFKVQRHYPSYLHLPDKQGRLVEWQEAGLLDPRGLLETEGLTAEMVRDYNVWKALFQYDVWLKRDGSQECTIIMDMKGFGLSKITPTMLRIFSLSYQVVQKHLPDREHVVVAINAPSWWGRIWAFFKPLLAKEQQRRLRVSTINEDPYLTLRELLDNESIPVAYGGSGIPLGTAPAEIMRRRYASEGSR